MSEKLVASSQFKKGNFYTIYLKGFPIQMRGRLDDEKKKQDELICYCFRVTRKEVEDLIRSLNLKTVDEVSLHSDACNGCRSCYPDILDLLGEIKKKG